MIPEIGQLALIVALMLALVQCVLPLVGAQRGWSSWVAVARPAAQGQFVFIAIAFGCLMYAFITNDFTVLYTASQSNSKLPLAYRIAGVWGGHEGSMLLWVLMLSVWTLAVTAFSRNLPDDMVARVIGVLGFISFGFILFILTTSNPFERLLPGAEDGRDLNPLLQDPGLVIHPPMLYMGYVGFSVAFAFAMAALISGKLDATWARWSRPWTTVAWVFLTGGICLGSWWAYYELGWGGWWFWDPVENASFMPWLVGTALIHSLAVTEKRGTFKNWTVLLALFAFSLSLLGTFLVRSGVLTSVHAFATDPTRGGYILMFLAVVIGTSLMLYAWRAPKVGLGGKFGMVSRESFLLINNVLLLVAAGAVLLGTLYPLVMDALGQGKISVGPPYFNAVFVPLMTPLLFLMAIGPVARWKNANVPEIVDRLKWALGVSVVTAILLPFVMGHWSWLVSLGLFLAMWIVSSIVSSIWRRAKQRALGGIEGGDVASASLSFYGMQLAHIGIAIFVVGVTLVLGYEEQKDVRMGLGDTAQIGNYTFRFEGVQEAQGPNYEATRGRISVFEKNKPLTVLEPEKRFYPVQQMPMTEAAIRPSIFGDLYASLGEPVSGGAWSVRLYYKPFVDWIWFGGFIMMLGGILAISDKRYRLAKVRAAAKAATQKTAEALG